jgi:hypothetical protein
MMDVLNAALDVDCAGWSATLPSPQVLPSPPTVTRQHPGLGFRALHPLFTVPGPAPRTTRRPRWCQVATTCWCTPPSAATRGC